MTINHHGSAVEAISANVANAKFEDFDEETVDSAKNRIIDVFGSAIGGANAPGNSELVELVKEWGGKGDATILIHGGKAPAHNVAMVNAIMARSFDFEVMGVLFEDARIASHHAPTTVMTALALGETLGIDGKELLTAVILGDDVTARVIAASGIDLGLGWDGTGTYTAFGAAAIAGRLLGLNELQIRNAFGIVLNQVASTVQGIWDGATTFKYGQGSAAMNGIVSAMLAKKGWKGVEDALQSRYGFYALYTHGCKNPELLTKKLGKKYYAEATFKPYPCCRATHTTIDASLDLISKYPIRIDEIDEVIIFGPERFLDVFVGKPFRIREYPHCDAIFSLQYTCATALLRKSVKQEHFTEKAINDPEVNSLIRKTRLSPFPDKTSNGVEVKVIVKGGQEFSASCHIAKGDPIDKPLSKEEIIAKYMSQVEFSQTVGKNNAEKLMDFLEKLDELDNIADIISLLVV